MNTLINQSIEELLFEPNHIGLLITNTNDVFINNIIANNLIMAFIISKIMDLYLYVISLIIVVLFVTYILDKKLLIV